MRLDELPLKNIFHTCVKYKEKNYIIDDINLRTSKVIMYELENWRNGIVVCLHDDIEVIKDVPSKY
uniref:Uncharacterized protein n=1 Tax=viral metagenome TaxID=1070528 RepID=A0A6M3M0T5_9ZZZZ